MSADLIGKSPDRRKLIAVMYADMVGYSRLIGLDDAGTLERLRTLRRELIDPAIEEHGGRIVQTGGDSLLIVFDSIDGAVRCAVKVQEQVPIHDGDQPSDRAIRFRVGINIGDAIADGTDLHGDAVNVAARIQAECPPGGICVSRAVRDHVHGRLDLAFEELGPLSLKNIARPVEAFVLKLMCRDYAEIRRAISCAWHDDALPLPDKPSIAVLAFTNMSGDPEQEYFSDGIADDIITELSRSRSLFVIARNSSFTYKGRAVDVKQVARELGVRYVVEGSVRRSGSRIRVTAQLIDAETGNHIWAERYDRALEDVFAVQDEITTRCHGDPTCRCRCGITACPPQAAGEPRTHGRRICVACGTKDREALPIMSEPSNFFCAPLNSMPPLPSPYGPWPRHTSWDGAVVCNIAACRCGEIVSGLGAKGDRY